MGITVIHSRDYYHYPDRLAALTNLQEFYLHRQLGWFLQREKHMLQARTISGDGIQLSISPVGYCSSWTLILGGAQLS